MERSCEPKREARKACPECGEEGKAVERITLESLLREPARIQDAPYWFCRTRECPVVYFSENGSLFRKPDLRVRVGLKETEDPIPVCYCFGWDRERIWKEIRETGKSTAVESITREVKAGRCFCERSNPEGTCCLGNVSRWVKEGLKEIQSQ